MQQRGYLFIGTYTENRWGKESKGIYLFRADYDRGTVEPCGTAEVRNPSYIAADAGDRNLYAVTETASPSAVSSFAFDPDAAALQKTASVASGEADPCNIIVSPDGSRIIVSNYSSGSVTVFPLRADGTVGEQEQAVRYSGRSTVSGRQDASHIHCARFCRCGKYLFVTDLGADALYRYTVSPDEGEYIDLSTFKKFGVEPGSGPRHFVFDPTGDYMYLINELSASVTVFRFLHGEITALQHLPILQGGKGDGGDIKISPDGRFVYASVRETSQDGIAVYRRDPQSGLLYSVYYQPCVRHPRNMEFTPGGKFLFVTGMKEGRVQVFACNSTTGRLADTGNYIDIPSPTCLVFTR